MRNLLGEFLFGGACYVCRGPARAFLCSGCASELPTLDGALCPQCALPSPGGALCGRCLSDPPAYDATIAALAYGFPADALVHALKFRGELSIAPYLARLLAGRIPPGDRIDFIVPVPLSRVRLRLRGYNQAVEIARHLPGKMDHGLCVRERDVTPQSELPWAQRQRNVRGAFVCKRPLSGMALAVVDDVMTSGATLNEMARTLKRAGAARVINWVVARTLLPA